MNPVFNDYRKFLKDKGIDYNLKEGYYWLDRQIIKAYDKKGNVHKIFRLAIDDDLNTTIKTIYKDKPFEIESWKETIARNVDRLNMLETESLKLISDKLSLYNEHIPTILSSGGKDSTVTVHLSQIVKPNMAVIFSNTSLDCADTYKYIKKQSNTRIINPTEGFYQWRKRLQFIPTRFSRACCTKFKEGAMTAELNKDDKYLFFMGMRNEESNARSGYTDEWKNDKWGDRKWNAILPIRKWTEEDIWQYILYKGLDINSKYKKGYARVGCSVCCPFYAKSTWILDQYWYKKQYDRWHDILEEDFVTNFKWTRVNCTLKEYHQSWNGGLLRPEPNDEVIAEFAKAKGIPIDIAVKYFNHTCPECDKKVNKKDVIAMNLKLLGRNTEEFYCKKHLMAKLDMDKDKWNEMIKRFKDLECSLF